MNLSVEAPSHVYNGNVSSEGTEKIRNQSPGCWLKGQRTTCSETDSTSGAGAPAGHRAARLGCSAACSVRLVWQWVSDQLETAPPPSSDSVRCEKQASKVHQLSS